MSFLVCLLLLFHLVQFSSSVHGKKAKRKKDDPSNGGDSASLPGDTQHNDEFDQDNNNNNNDNNNDNEDVSHNFLLADHSGITPFLRDRSWLSPPVSGENFMDQLTLGDISNFDSGEICLSGGPARSDLDTLSVGIGRATTTVEPLRMTIRTNYPSTGSPSSSSTGNQRFLVGAGNTFVAHSHLPSSSSTIPSSYSVRPRSSTSSTTTRPTTAKVKKLQANGSSEVAEIRNDIQSLRSMVQQLAQSTNDIVTRLNEQDALNRLHATQNRNRMTDFSSTGLDNSQPRLETRTRQINI